MIFDFLALFKIGFLPVRLWDILDILIVGYLMYQIYRLLKGNIAFNILIGVLTLFVVWELVKMLEMVVLEAALQRFAGVGMLIIVIIFQQEIRRFLLFLGNTTLRQRAQFLDRFLDKNLRNNEGPEEQVQAIVQAVLQMAKRKTGALIVLTQDVALEGIVNTGTALHADLSEALLLSIFNKYSPLHDGAVLVKKGKLIAASCILPVSENPDLPKSAGLRHRAAVGITERFGVVSLVVSEETGIISFAQNGKLERKKKEEELRQLIREHW